MEGKCDPTGSDTLTMYFGLSVVIIIFRLFWFREKSLSSDEMPKLKR